MKLIIKQVLAGLALALLWSFASARDGKPIRIGEIGSYSMMPEFGAPYRNGWLLALEEINAAGGVNGRKVVVISHDDGGKPESALRHAQELVVDQRIDVLAGTFLPATALAVSNFAARNKKLFVAAEASTDALTLDKGNRYTFRLAASTYMLAAMLAEEAIKLPARRWAIVAPNYEYGQSVVASFKLLLKAKRPDVVFVAEQWPALGKLKAEAVVRLLARARPEAIFNATSGVDLEKFVREGNLRGLFEKTSVVSTLAGAPESLDGLKDQILTDWIITGYPREQIDTPEHRKFMAAYTAKYNENPQFASVLGYTTMMALAEGIRKAGSTDSEKLIAAMRGLRFGTPLGVIAVRELDQQATMGAYVGRLDLLDGKAVMRQWRYADGKDYLPDAGYVRSRRPAAAMR